MFETGIDFDYDQLDFLESIEDEFTNSPRPPNPMQDISNLELRTDSSFPLNSSRTRNVGKTVMRRKFPGPAGLLPERTGNQSLLVTEEFNSELEKEKKEIYNCPKEQIMSQASETKFESGAWMAMMRDLDSDCRSLMCSVNLNSVQKLGRVTRKIPFLAVLIQSVDSDTPDPTLVLKDPYDCRYFLRGTFFRYDFPGFKMPRGWCLGEIHGTLHKDVIEQFYQEIAPGNVVVLRNVAVITSGVLSRKQLVITENNLVSFYTNSDGKLQARQVGSLEGVESLKLATSEWLEEKPTPTKKRSNPSTGCDPRFAPPLKNPRVQPIKSSSSLSAQRNLSAPAKSNPTFDLESLLAGIDADAFYDDF